MKAFDIVMFMLLFNSVMIGLSASGIVDVASPGSGNVSIITEFIGVPYVGEAIIAAVVVGVLAASITVFGSQPSKPVAVGVAFFGALYAFTLVGAMGILYGLQVGGTHIIPLWIIAILTTMNVLVFIFGMFQMVTGSGER